MSKHPKARLPKQRERREQQDDRPARAYNRPPDVRLLDVRGLLIVLGLAFAGFALAFVFTRYSL